MDAMALVAREQEDRIRFPPALYYFFEGKSIPQSLPARNNVLRACFFSITKSRIDRVAFAVLHLG
jgi:hypothetical protein